MREIFAGKAYLTGKMGLHPDEIGQLSYPDFARYLSYYTNPGAFFETSGTKEDAMDKLATYHDIQQDIIRRAEEKKGRKV